MGMLQCAYIGNAWTNKARKLFNGEVIKEQVGEGERAGRCWPEGRVWIRTAEVERGHSRG